MRKRFGGRGRGRSKESLLYLYGKGGREGLEGIELS